MEIIFKRKFLKQYKKLRKSDQKKVDDALELFGNNPFEPKLKNHALLGKLDGERSISAAFDLRIIFETYDNYLVVTMLNVGTHNQVY